ncbi:hypothetical protein Val02_67630 [Virgisporangium aliadipatigenens]|uniref:Uncharacterized protein n=1 Tax=Virgisporangium aliadipatigenens TaxID=741659 RepID=A0A8J3YSL1_9ACTN|nr:hypothetical protein [Virgisporangium aliadipatigenens]GIJ49877.1 hypothetical protein Val02_67630 [Virgisporangium aliadipatigenens]
MTAPNVDPMVDAYDQLAVRMYDLDAHPGLTLCRSPLVAGVTAERWRALEPELPRLWTAFTHLGVLVTRARDLRGPGRPRPAAQAELTALLAKALVGLDDDGVPVPETGTPTLFCTVPELLELVQARYRGLTQFLSTVDAEAVAKTERVNALQERILRLRQPITEFGETEAWRRALALLGDVHAKVAADPLGAEVTADLESVGAVLDAEERRVSGLGAVRDGFPERLGRLHGALDELVEAERRAAAAGRTAREKTLAQGLPEPPARADELRAEITHLDRLAAGQSWERLAAGLDRVEREVVAAHDAALHHTTAAQGLLDRREELRGRLRAYEVKAARVGAAEEPAVVEVHTQVRELLSVRPCDLAAATRALARYQQVLADSERRRGSVR